MLKRILPLLLSLLLLTGCSGKTTIEMPEPEVGLTVAYVPLDDREVNDDRVVYLAESLGLDFQMPERTLYHTVLDYQEVNPNGSQYGDRGALWEWVMEQEAAGCDAYILSLDQLFSGGLVNSRSVHSGDDIVFPDGTILTEWEVIDQYLMPLLNDPDNQVYLFDTVMRLAPTVGYEGFGLEEYSLLRTYAMSARPALEGETLTVENIVAGYTLDENGAVITPPEGVTQEMVDNYFTARERKLMLADVLLTATEGMDNAHWLIGVDDSAPTDSVQTAELAFLRQAIEGRGAVLSGADEGGMLMLCRLYEDLCFTGEMPTVQVRYYGGSEGGASSDFDHQSMVDIVDEHLAYLDVPQTTDSNADIELLVLTAAAEGATQTWEDMITQINANEKAEMPTMVMDAAKYTYGETVKEALIDQVNLGSLFSYGGYYDLATVTGVVTANGLSRWMHLSENGVVSMEENLAYAKTVADICFKDMCYRTNAKMDLYAYVLNELEGDPDNFARYDTDTTLTQAYLEQAMLSETEAVIKNLEKSEMMVTLDGDWMDWGTIILSDFYSPWSRVFELRYNINFDNFG